MHIGEFHELFSILTMSIDVLAKEDTNWHLWHLWHLWLWPFRLINSFPAYQHFLLKHSLSKLSLLIKAWTCSIFPTFSEIIESPLKFLSISRILNLLLFAISIKILLEISFQLQPSNFWSWCSEFHSAIMILCGLAVSVSTCWTCCHRWPYLYSWQRITVTL